MRILLIGASGNFGRRLAKLLAGEAGIALVLAGRRRDALETLAVNLCAVTPSRHSGESRGPASFVARDSEASPRIKSGATEHGMGRRCEIVALDRDTLAAETLRTLNVALVIDASGPFQLMDATVIEACISAGVHYVDLADGRAFVAGITRFEAAAKAADTAVITGASSTPALSHAVIDALTQGWQRIDTLRITISPSNRQPRGRAVVEAILAGIGQRLRLFRLDRWQDARGWGGLRRVTLPHVGRRWASLCDTPDLDLLVSRYQPRLTGEFLASLELSAMHLGLAALGWLVRIGLMRSLIPLTTPLIGVAALLQPFGNDMGGMLVEADGQDESGAPVQRRWWLAAKGDIGPHVPVLAALNVARMLRDGMLAFRGATPCVGLVPLAAFAEDFAVLGINTGTETIPLARPIFEQVLGARFDALPPVTQSLHRPGPASLWRGEGCATRGTHPVARTLARLFAFPHSDRPVPLVVAIQAHPDGSEDWHRVWPDQTMHSRMALRAGLLEECFGPFAFTLALDAHADGIDMQIIRGRLWGMPLPRFLVPQTRATERAEGDRHCFDVMITLPFVGPLVHYSGWLVRT